MTYHSASSADLSLTGLLGRLITVLCFAIMIGVSGLMAYAGLGGFNHLHSQEIDLKAATDGRCDYWLPMLQENPTETVHMTLGLNDQAEIKILVDGDRWRMVLLAKSDSPMGCVFIEDEGVLFRDGEAP